MARLNRRNDFIREATGLLQAMRITLAQIQGATVQVAGAAPTTIARTRVEEAIARLATLPRMSVSKMMQLPAEQLRLACEMIVSPGQSRVEVLAWLRSQGHPIAKSAFYRFVNSFVSMYRQAQAWPATVERPSTGV